MKMKKEIKSFSLIFILSYYITNQNAHFLSLQYRHYLKYYLTFFFFLYNIHFSLKFSLKMKILIIRRDLLKRCSSHLKKEKGWFEMNEQKKKNYLKWLDGELNYPCRLYTIQYDDYDNKDLIFILYYEIRLGSYYSFSLIV